MIYHSLGEAAEHIEPRKVLLGLDLGTRFVGIASSNPEHSVAAVHSVYRRTGSLHRDAKHVGELAQRKKATAIVVGYPFFHDRNNGWKEQIERFSSALHSLSGIVVFQDEDHSTRYAKEILGIKSRARKRSVLVDRYVRFGSYNHFLIPWSHKMCADQASLQKEVVGGDDQQS